MLILPRLDKVNGPVAVDPLDVGIARQFGNGLGRQRHVEDRRQRAKVVMDRGRHGQDGRPPGLVLVFDVRGRHVDGSFVGAWFGIAWPLVSG